jgi:hypothetical protein
MHQRVPTREQLLAGGPLVVLEVLQCQQQLGISQRLESLHGHASSVLFL